MASAGRRTCAPAPPEAVGLNAYHTLPDVVGADGTSEFAFPSMSLAPWDNFDPDHDWEFSAEIKKLPGGPAGGFGDIFALGTSTTHAHLRITRPSYGNGVGGRLDFLWYAGLRPDGGQRTLFFHAGLDWNDNTVYELRLVYDSSQYTQGGGGTNPDMADFTVYRRTKTSDTWESGRP